MNLRVNGAIIRGDKKPAIESTAARNPCALPCSYSDILFKYTFCHHKKPNAKLEIRLRISES